MGFDEPILADHRDGAAELETVSEATGVDGDARVRALIMAKRCKNDIKNILILPQHDTFGPSAWI